MNIFKFKRAQFSLKITLISILLSTVMLWCSHWQYTKYLAKVEMIERITSSSNETLKAFPIEQDESIYEGLQYSKFKVRGTFDLERQIIVTNRKHVTGPGHELYAPFNLEGTKFHFWVNRGFIPFEDYSIDSIRKYDQTGVIDLAIIIRPAIKKKSRFSPSAINPLTTASNTQKESHVFKWFYADISQMNQQLPYKTIENVYLQVISFDKQKKFPAQTSLIDIPPSTHFGYTIEWILLALFTISIGTLIQLFPRKTKVT